jgi:hypothetical protein
VSFATITLCVASQRVFVVVSIYFVIDSVRKLLDSLSYLPKVKVKLSLCFSQAPLRESSPRTPIVQPLAQLYTD